MKLSKVKIGMKVIFKGDGETSFPDHDFHGGEVGNVIGLDFSPDVDCGVKVENLENVEWVSHRDIKKARVGIPQSVFDSLDASWTYAARDSGGMICVYMQEPYKSDGVWWSNSRGDDIEDFDIYCPDVNVNWEKSLIKREKNNEII